MRRVYIYKRFERFWHWAQTLLILASLLTGFGMRFPSLGLLDFETAAWIHQVLGISLLILTTFGLFWHATTGEWKQYLPTRKFLKAMIHFYLVGIFHQAPHPVQKTELAKFNPLQRLAYLGFQLFIFPALALTGLLYLLLTDGSSLGFSWLSLSWVAQAHVFAAYLLVAFIIFHIYLTTTGATLSSNLKAMITGWEKIEEAEDETDPKSKN